MGALAKLPIFLDLAGKRAVVAGGTVPAAWKAELLAAAGADVEVYAEEVSDEMSALLRRGAAQGSVSHIPHIWSEGIMAGAAVALADCEDADEAGAFARAARAHGVPYNVIDKPEHCQFQFGSIVNRSPVVVGISTDGAAPILGQTVRQRIETLLPPALAAWANVAKLVRSATMEQLAPGPERRRFWTALSEMAFTRPASEATTERAAGLLREARSRGGAKSGRVTLVGAGPGDAGLLTLNAVRALQSADVILFDDLVSADVLELARREAKRMMVGKRGKRPSCAQDDINAMMIDLVRKGRHVVRLKSGDPMIFGRAGEEIEELAAAGIPVDVVPGITSALAMAAKLGVSLTHRDHAQSVRFVTGHARSGMLPDDLDWPGIADTRTTTVFYMGGRTAGAIAKRLIAHGMAPDTPAVVVAGATSDRQAVWHGPVCDMAIGVASIAADLPILIGIGSVFAKAVARLDVHPVANAG